MKTKWLLIGVALLMTVLAIGAVACSDDDDDDGDAPAATEATDDEPIGLPTGDTNTVIVTGGILTDSIGNTLYVFDNDEAGVSTCGDGCVDIWPPLAVEGDATAGDGVDGTLATITRDDGTTQATYNGQPLYHYAIDDEPGDRNGDDVGGVWHIVVVGG